MWTLATCVRTDVAEDFKKYCEERSTSCTFKVKRLIEAALDEWYKKLKEREKQHFCSTNRYLAVHYRSQLAEIFRDILRSQFNNVNLFE